MIKTTLTIEGMMCSMCENHMNTALQNAFDLKKVTSSHQKKQTVILSAENLDEEKIKQTVSDAGFTLVELKTEPYKKFKLFGK